MHVIKKGKYYVSKPGSKNSYTDKLELAQKFGSKEEAEKHKCGNEIIIEVRTIIDAMMR